MADKKPKIETKTDDNGVKWEKVEGDTLWRRVK